jgi:hypothetical protein
VDGDRGADLTMDRPEANKAIGAAPLSKRARRRSATPTTEPMPEVAPPTVEPPRVEAAIVVRPGDTEPTVTVRLIDG